MTQVLTRARLDLALDTLQQLEQLEDDGTVSAPGFHLEVSRLTRIKLASIFRCRLRWYGIEPGTSWDKFG